MEAGDEEAGLGLSSQAGWNQSAADWRRVRTLAAEGAFVAEGAAGVVGTAAAVAFGDVAWICLVLVEESLRGRGIGTSLVSRALDFCDGRGIPTVRLDATALGRPVYEKLGFRPDYSMARYVGTVDRCSPPGGATRPLAAADLDEASRLDRECSGCDRSRLLRRLFEEAPEEFLGYLDGETLRGFIHSRPGRDARQVGPCVAAGPGYAAALFDYAARGAVYVDIPQANDAATRWAEERGLNVQRTLTRMSRGRTPIERRELLWSGSGPEKG